MQGSSVCTILKKEECFLSWDLRLAAQVLQECGNGWMYSSLLFFLFSYKELQTYSQTGACDFIIFDFGLLCLSDLGLEAGEEVVLLVWDDLIFSAVMKMFLWSADASLYVPQLGHNNSHTAVVGFNAVPHHVSLAWPRTGKAWDTGTLLILYEEASWTCPPQLFYPVKTITIWIRRMTNWVTNSFSFSVSALKDQSYRHKTNVFILLCVYKWC